MEAMAASSSGASSSIIPYLPPFCKSDSGSWQWPPELGYALKALVRGPEFSTVSDAEALCDAINDLREQSHLPPLASAALEGYSLFFDDLIPRATSKEFFGSVLPGMADLVFRLPGLLSHHLNGFNDGLDPGVNYAPTVISANLRLLVPQQSGVVYLSQELVAAILACAFFCLYPSKGREEAQLPYFNFDGLFSSIHKSAPQQEQKALCIIHYFIRIHKQLPEGMVSYERKVLPRRKSFGSSSQILEPDERYWNSSLLRLCPIQVFTNGSIEDQHSNAVEVDFANRYLGGGVLFHGSVQEEIRFAISPELIAGMLFMPAMHKNEAIEITGAERFSCYEGYGASFCFAGEYIDQKLRDLQGRRRTSIVAIDALMKPGRHQFEKAMMLRETNKAFCGFLDHSRIQGLTGLANQWRNGPNDILSYFPGLQHCEIMEAACFQDIPGPSDEIEVDAQRSGKASIFLEEVREMHSRPISTPTQGSTVGIATGNWGCGAFGGDVELKSLLQWIAASQAERPFLHYFSFGGTHGQRLQQLTDWIRNEKWCVGELWGLLIEYGEKRLNGECCEGLFDWILPHMREPPLQCGMEDNI